MARSTVETPGDAKTDEAAGLEPTQAEIDAWVARERERRQAWLKGPSDEEREAYARRLRQRRAGRGVRRGRGQDRGGRPAGGPLRARGAARRRGCDAVLMRWSRRTFDDMVRAGREWEEETSLPNRRRRVPLDDEDS